MRLARRRVVQLMYRDDLDTPPHVDLYDRLAVRADTSRRRSLPHPVPGEIDDKVKNSLNDHVHACWINRGAAPGTAPPRRTHHLGPRRQLRHSRPQRAAAAGEIADARERNIDLVEGWI